jgi:hypothetical protein
MIPANPWQETMMTIVVRAYPNPSGREGEAVCCAAISDDGRLLRLYPVPWRQLDAQHRFSPGDRIRARIRKSKDPRRESYNLDRDSLEIIKKDALSWPARTRAAEGFDLAPLCDLRQQAAVTLSFQRVRDVSASITLDRDARWTPEDMSKLAGRELYEAEPRSLLEKLPFTLWWRFKCAHGACNGHRLHSVDGPAMEWINRERRARADDWDTYATWHFNALAAGRQFGLWLGTMRVHVHSWIVIGHNAPPAGLARAAVLEAA